MGEDDSRAPLFHAARRGDVGFLTEALKNRADYHYFLAQTKEGKCNILQLAIQEGKHEFVREAMSKLKVIAVRLILQRDINGENSLHFAARQDNLETVKTLVNTYKDNIDKVIAPDLSSTIIGEGLAEVIREPPWLMQDSESMTPLHFALLYGYEDIAIYISLLDTRLLTEFYYSGNSAICFAISQNCGRYVEHILLSGWNYSLEGEGGTTALHLISLHTEEKMKRAAKLLLEKHPELINKLDDEGESILSYAVSKEEEWFVKLMILPEEIVTGPWIKACRKLILEKNFAGDTPLHITAHKGNLNIAKLIVEAYNSFLDEHSEQPWIVRNSKDDTPFIVALKNKEEEFALYMISLMGDFVALDNSRTGEGAVYLAVLGGCEQVSEILLQKYDECALQGPNGQNPLHVASNCTEAVATFLVEEYPHLVKKKDKSEKTPLYIASERGTEWLVRLLLTRESSLIDDEPLVWKVACINGHLEVILAFIELLPNLKNVCRINKDTPLHHVKLQNSLQYERLLCKQVILEFKDFQNGNKDTPLHLAIKRKDLPLTELLLKTYGVDPAIEDKDGITALDLIEEYNDRFDNWEKMCRRINLNPKLETSYVKRTTNFKDMQGTLSVVAALLATITFAAAFTIPGGFNNNGEAIFATKASFLVFMLSDTFSMCCSLLVLFFLIWAAIWGKNREALVFIDRSIHLLQLALGGTVVAFMAGVFTMMSNKSLWAAIIIICMCSLAFLIAAIPMFADRNILYKIVKGLIPTPSRRWANETNC